MNPRSFRFPKSAPQLLAAVFWCVPLAGACSSNDDAPVTPTTFGVEVTSLDGQDPDKAIELRCDRGGVASAAGGAGDPAASPGFFSTLVVAVATTPTALATEFVLRPAHACGTSTRCGYIHIEGLDASGTVLTSVDTSTTEGVLQLDLAQLPTQLRVSLVRGLDQKTLRNPDKTEVSTSLTPSFVVPDCMVAPSGGGAGGAGSGGESSGGASGAGSAGESSAGSAGESSAGAGGASGDANQSGGAGGTGGDGSQPGGAGGADNASSGVGGA